MKKKFLLFLFLLIGLPSSLLAEAPFYIYQKEVIPTGQELTMGIQGKYVGQKMEVTLYRITNPQAFLSMQKTFHKPQIENTKLRAALNYAIKQAPSGGVPKLYGPTAEFKAPKECPFVFEKTLGFTLTKKGLPDYERVPLGIKKAGLYLVEVRADNYITYSLGLVTNLALILRRAPEKTLVYAVDLMTGLPRREVKIGIYRKSRLILSGKTGKDGVYTATLPYSPQFLLVAEDGENLALCDPSFFPASSDNLKGFLFTERPLYLPGEKVYFKGIFRVQKDGAYQLPPSEIKKVKYQILNSRRSSVAQGEIPLNALGSCAGEFNLPEKCSLGKYTFLLTLDQKSFTGEFKVEVYQKPKIQVLVSSPVRAVVMGEKALFKVQGLYYMGGVVKKGKVSYTLMKSQFDQPLFSETGLASFYSPEEFKSFESSLVERGETTLDEKGICTLTFPTKKEAHSMMYRLMVQVTDETRSVAGGGGSLQVAKGAFRMGVKADKSLYRVEEDLFLTVKAESILGGGVEAPFEVHFIRRGRQYPKGGYSGRMGRLLPKQEDVPDKLLFTLKGRTDKDGMARVRGSVPKAGEIEVQIKAIDQYKNPVEAAINVWVEKGNSPIYYSGSAIRLIPDKKSYRVGDKAKILVVAPIKGVAPLITLEGNSLINYSTDPFSANTRVLTVEITKEMAPNVYLTASAIWKGGFMETSRMILVPPAEKIIHLKVSLDSPDYKPGQKALIKITAKDSKGQPLSADIALGVVDESLYSLEEESTAPLLPFFYSLRRKNVGSGQSTLLDSYGYAQLSKRLPAPPVTVTKTPKKKAMRESERSLNGGGRGSGGTRSRLHRNGGTRPSPRPTSAPRAEDRPGRASDDLKKGKKKGGKEETTPATATRTLFRTTAFWAPFVRTNEKGEAEVKFQFPENLTTWRLTLRALDKDTRIGWLNTQTQTRLLVAVRATLPAFLVRGDRIKAYGTVHNFQDEKDTLTLKVEVKGGLKINSAPSAKKEIPSQEALNLPLELEAQKIGMGKIQLQGVGKKYGDALEENFPILPRGIEITHSIAQKLKDGKQDLTSTELIIPKGTHLGRARLMVRITPGYIAAVRQALPYLIGYPYGCTEQTMSRFVPDMAAAQVFKDLKIGSLERSEKLEKFVQAGLERIFALQNRDGGWGWWRRDGSHPLMTAYVVWGLGRAKELGYPIKDEPFSKGLKASLKFAGQKDLPQALRIYNIYSFFLATRAMGRSIKDQIPLLDQIYDQNRASLQEASRALLVMALLEAHRKTEAALEIKELEKSALKAKGADGTSLTYWGNPQGRRWSNNHIEVTALVARALIQFQPNHPMVESTLEWLMGQRRGAIWQSTRNTAAVVETLLHYIQRKKKRDSSEGMVTIQVNKVSETVVLAENRLEIPFGKESLLLGQNTLMIEGKKLKGVYIDAYLSYYTTEEKIAAHEAGFKIKREYFLVKTSKKEGKLVYDLDLLKQENAPGETIMVRLTIETPKDRTFVMVEDPIPATARIVRKDRDLQFADAVKYHSASHREFQKAKTVFFFTDLKAGKTCLRYYYRTGMAGHFQALPAQARLMYFPYVSGNSRSQVVVVK